MKKIVAGLGLALLCATGVSIAENHHQSTSAFKVTEIKKGFHFLQGKGGNILLSDGSDGLLIVDSDYADMSGGLQKTLDTFGKPLKYILNTHWHGDHTQGNKLLGKGSTIVAHDNVYQRLNSQQEVKLFNMVSPPYPKHALPDITYDHRMTIHFNDHEITVMHLPGGHTDGDSVIYYKGENIIHLGDLFFNGFYPFVDVDTGGRVRGMAQNIGQILEMIDEQTQIVPGHGPMANKADLVAFRDMLLGTANEVESMMKDKTLEQIQSTGLSAKWDEWEDGFLNEATWIRIVFDSLHASQHGQAKGHSHKH